MGPIIIKHLKKHSISALPSTSSKIGSKQKGGPKGKENYSRLYFPSLSSQPNKGNVLSIYPSILSPHHSPFPLLSPLPTECKGIKERLDKGYPLNKSVSTEIKTISVVLHRNNQYLPFFALL